MKLPNYPPFLLSDITRWMRTTDVNIAKMTALVCVGLFGFTFYLERRSRVSNINTNKFSLSQEPIF